MKRHLLVLVAMLNLAACTGVPEGIAPVTGFDVNRYLGTWYEIVRLDHRFERGLEQVTASYSERSDGGIRVLNRGFDQQQKRWKEAEGKAYFNGSNTVGRLKVSFFGPFYAAYNIIRLDPDYQYVMICGNNRDYFWILSRTPTLDQPTLSALLQQATELGFDREAMIMVNQNGPGPADVPD